MINGHVKAQGTWRKFKENLNLKTETLLKYATYISHISSNSTPQLILYLYTV